MEKIIKIKDVENYLLKVGLLREDDDNMCLVLKAINTEAEELLVHIGAVFENKSNKMFECSTVWQVTKNKDNFTWQEMGLILVIDSAVYKYTWNINKYEISDKLNLYHKILLNKTKNKINIARKKIQQINHLEIPIELTNLDKMNDVGFETNNEFMTFYIAFNGFAKKFRKKLQIAVECRALPEKYDNSSISVQIKLKDAILSGFNAVKSNFILNENTFGITQYIGAFDHNTLRLHGDRVILDISYTVHGEINKMQIKKKRKEKTNRNEKVKEIWEIDDDYCAATDDDDDFEFDDEDFEINDDGDFCNNDENDQKFESMDVENDDEVVENNNIDKLEKDMEFEEMIGVNKDDDFEFDKDDDDGQGWGDLCYEEDQPVKFDEELCWKCPVCRHWIIVSCKTCHKCKLSMPNGAEIKPRSDYKTEEKFVWTCKHCCEINSMLHNSDKCKKCHEKKCNLFGNTYKKGNNLYKIESMYVNVQPYWNCIRCTLRNDLEATKCILCGHPKHDVSMRYAAKLKKTTNISKTLPKISEEFVDCTVAEFVMFGFIRSRSDWFVPDAVKLMIAKWVGNIQRVPLDIWPVFLITKPPTYDYWVGCLEIKLNFVDKKYSDEIDLMIVGKDKNKVYNWIDVNLTLQIKDLEYETVIGKKIPFDLNGSFVCHIEHICSKRWLNHFRDRNRLKGKMDIEITNFETKSYWQRRKLSAMIPRWHFIRNKTYDIDLTTEATGNPKPDYLLKYVDAEHSMAIFLITNSRKRYFELRLLKLPYESRGIAYQIIDSDTNVVAIEHSVMDLDLKNKLDLTDMTKRGLVDLQNGRPPIQSIELRIFLHIIDEV